MQFLYFLEKIRNPVFDFFFSAVTHIGEETVFLAIAILFFWCVNKRKGYYILITGLVGTLVNQMLKLVCKVPRPWVKDPDFTVVEGSKAEATGYSFPSGHTQNVAGTFGAIGASYKSRAIKISAAAVILLVALSRMYLGVHTPWDVLTSLAIAGLLVFVLYPLFATEERFNKSMPYVVLVSFLLSVGFVVYVLFMPNKPSLADPNYSSAMKNAYTLFGCTLGLVVVYALDTMYIKFDTHASWYVQIIKLVVGFAIVIAIKSGLSSPLNALFGNDYVGRAMRYFIIVLFAGALWPLTFRYLAKIKIKSLDNFGVKVACKLSKKYAERLRAERKAEKKRNTPPGKRIKKKR